MKIATWEAKNLLYTPYGADEKDVASEARLIALTALRKGVDEEPLLRLIVRRKLIDWARHLNRLRHAEIMREPHAKKTPQPHEFLDIIHSLPLMLQRLLIGRFFMGRTEKEIAEREGLTQSRISQLYQKALAALRK